MPKYIEKEVGRIVHRRQVPTLGDKIKDVLGRVVMTFILVFVLIGLFA